MTRPKSSDTNIMPFVDLCRRIVARLRMRTRYTRALEDEVARLRAENRGLVNSILGVAGIPPMRMVAAAREVRADSVTHVGSRGVCVTDMRDLDRDPGKTSRQPDIRRPAGRELQVPGEIAVPLRKRSWQQIERAREIEDARAARRERETDTETFPTPRNIVPRV